MNISTGIGLSGSVVNCYCCVQFIDLCILLGCDYCDSLRGIGPKRAVELIKQHKTIEAAVKAIDTKVADISYVMLM